jgi:hypothetical protein
MPFNIKPRRFSKAPLPAPAEIAMKDRNTLYRDYRRSVLAEREQLFRSSQDGEALRIFATAIKQSPDVERQAVTLLRQAPWLRNAPEAIRLEAIRIINESIMQQRLKQNKHPLSDPLPGQPDDTYRSCKRELGL